MQLLQRCMLCSLKGCAMHLLLIAPRLKLESLQVKISPSANGSGAARAPEAPSTPPPTAPKASCLS